MADRMPSQGDGTCRRCDGGARRHKREQDLVMICLLAAAYVGVTAKCAQVVICTTLHKMEKIVMHVGYDATIRCKDILRWLVAGMVAMVNRSSTAKHFPTPRSSSKTTANAHTTTKSLLIRSLLITAPHLLRKVHTLVADEYLHRDIREVIYPA